jgi:biopolymer transport protein TolR
MKTGNGDSRLMSEINIVPFVDVMLVLLIIFMMGAPMLSQGVEVNLPKTTSKIMKTREDPLMVTVNTKGKIFLEEQEVDLQGLESKVRSIFENRIEKEVLLRADQDVSYGFVIGVIARIKRAGIDKLGMVTEPED